MDKKEIVVVFLIILVLLAVLLVSSIFYFKLVFSDFGMTGRVVQESSSGQVAENSQNLEDFDG